MKYSFGHKVFQLEIQMMYNKQIIGRYKANTKQDDNQNKCKQGRNL